MPNTAVPRARALEALIGASSDASPRLDWFDCCVTAIGPDFCHSEKDTNSSFLRTASVWFTPTPSDRSLDLLYPCADPIFVILRPKSNACPLSLLQRGQDGEPKDR